MGDLSMLNTYTGFLKSTKANEATPTTVDASITAFIKGKSYRLVPFSKDLILIFLPSEESFILFGNRNQGGNIDFNTIPPFTEIEISDVTKAEIETIDTAYSLLKLTVTAKVYYKIDKYYKNEGGGQFIDIVNIVFYMLPLNASLDAVQIQAPPSPDKGVGSALRATGAFMGVAYTTEQKAKIDEIITKITTELDKIVTPIFEEIKKIEPGKLNALNEIMNHKGLFGNPAQKTKLRTNYNIVKETLNNIKNVTDEKFKAAASAADATAGKDNLITQIRENLYNEWKKESLSQDYTSLVTNEKYKAPMIVLKQFSQIHTKLKDISGNTDNDYNNQLQLIHELYEGLTKSNIGDKLNFTALPDPEVKSNIITRTIGEGIIGFGRAIGQTLAQGIFKTVTKPFQTTSIKPPSSGGGKYVMYKKKEYKARENTKGTYIVVDGKRKYVTLT